MPETLSNRPHARSLVHDYPLLSELSRRHRLYGIAHDVIQDVLDSLIAERGERAVVLDRRPIYGPAEEVGERLAEYEWLTVSDGTARAIRGRVAALWSPRPDRKRRGRLHCPACGLVLSRCVHRI